MSEIINIIFRTLVVYFFLIIAIRLFGKKEITQLSIVDLVFILLISNSVQNAMVGPSSSLQAGLVAAASLFLANEILKQITYRSKSASKFLEGEPITLVYKGKVMKEHLQRARVTEDELNEAIREHGVEKVSEVDLAILEVDGNISVMSENFKKKSVKKRKAHRVVSKYF